MKLTNLSKNVVLSECSVIVKLVMQFVVRTVFLRQLAIEYLGASDLFATVISVLSIGQMGFGNAMKYAMYRPIAQEDHRRTKAIVDIYHKVYYIIGAVLIVLGFLIYPILLSARREEMTLSGLFPAYIFLMLDMGIYYLFKSDKDLLIASQREYAATAGETLAVMIQGVLQILFLTCLHSFPLYFAAKLIGSLFSMAWIKKEALKLHPYLKSKEKIPLDQDSMQEIRKNTLANMINTIGNTITDNIDYLLAFFTAGLGQVGILTNYKLIMNSVTQFCDPAFRSALGPVGHLGATADRREMLDYFYAFLLVGFWCFGFSSIALICLMNPFVRLWAGEEYVTTELTVLVMVAVFYSKGIYVAVSIFRDALGLFWENRYRKLTESILNLILSLILVKPLGMLGLFLGTLISDLAVTFWMNPYNLYKYGFREKVSHYFRRYAFYTGVIAAAGLLTFFLGKTTESLPLMASFLLKMLICTVVPNGIIYLIVRKTSEFHLLKSYILSILGHSGRKQS